MQQFQPQHHASQAHIQAGVTFVNMAEFVRHQTHKFVTAEVIERALGDANHAIGLAPACGKGVDAGITGQHKSGGRAHIGRQRHFLHDIGELDFSGAAAGHATVVF